MNIQDDSGEGNRANGRWTKEQHQKFLLGLELFNKNWKKISDFVGTRTGSQIRSHAQKFFMKLNHRKRQQQDGENQANENICGVASCSKQNLNNELTVEKIEALGGPFFWSKMYEINKENQGFCLWDYIDQERKNEKLKQKLQKKSNSFKYCEETTNPLRQIYIIENNNQK